MDTTFPQLLLKHAAERPQAPAMREKEYGIWQTLTWSQLADMAQSLAAGRSEEHTSELQSLAYLRMPSSA